MRFARSLVVLAVSLPAVATARPLMNETPTPSPVATATPAPVASATPEAAASPTPGSTAIPVASPTAEPAVSATPLASPSPSPAASSTPPPLQEPLATPTAEPEATPVPAGPVDYTAGMPGSTPGSRRVRAGIEMGFHVFAGQGWDRKAGPPPNDRPAASSDFVGGSLVGFALYDLMPAVALSGTLGGHNGTHSENTGIGTPHVTTALNAWYADAGLRLQTPANIAGVWLEGGGGAYLGRRTITTKTSSASKIDVTNRGGFTAHVSAGVLYHLAQGLDIFGETRWMTLPGRFKSDDRLDLGGFTVLAGASLRL